jgi:hypothetical protein
MLLALKPHTSSPIIEPSTAILASPVSPEKGVEVVSKGDIEQKEMESVVSYVTVTATATAISTATSVSVSTSIATVEAETIVVTMTREVEKVEASAAPEVERSSSSDSEESKVDVMGDENVETEVLHDTAELTNEASGTQGDNINNDEQRAQGYLEEMVV